MQEALYHQTNRIEERHLGFLGVYRSELALRLARSERPHAVRLLADAKRLDARFSPESFDLVTVFDALYHGWALDEVELLQRVWRTLRPGGMLTLARRGAASG